MNCHSLAWVLHPLTMAWFYAIGDEQRGPVSSEELRRLVAEGVVHADTMVRREGWDDCRTYGSMLGEEVRPKTVEIEASELCAMSGRRMPKNQMIQYKGRWVGLEYRNEFFRRIRDDVVLPLEMKFAGFWARVAAKLLDGVILGVISAAVMVGLYWLMSPLLKGGTPEEQPLLFFGAAVALQVSGLLVAVGYAVFFIREFNATPGKMILGLKVVRQDGSKLSMGRIAGRYLAERISVISLMVGYVMVAFDEAERRALHDRMADTRVICVR